VVCTKFGTSETNLKYEKAELESEIDFKTDITSSEDTLVFLFLSFTTTKSLS
jgi:tyrosyl-tRNA synthetase